MSFFLLIRILHYFHRYQKIAEEAKYNVSGEGGGGGGKRQEKISCGKKN